MSLFAQSKCPSFVFCFFGFFSPPSCYLLSLKRPDGKGSDTLADISVLPDAQNPHESARENTHFLHGSFCHPLPSFLSHQREKKPQTTTFLIKFLWALFCLATPSLNLKKNQALVDLFFWQFFCFQGARKASVPPQGFPYVVPFFWFLFFVFWNKNEKKAVGLDGGPTMSYPPYWVCFFVFCFKQWHHTPDPSGGSVTVGDIWLLRQNICKVLFFEKLNHDLLPNLTTFWFSAREISKTVVVVGFLHIFCSPVGLFSLSYILHFLVGFASDLFLFSYLFFLLDQWQIVHFFWYIWLLIFSELMLEHFIFLFFIFCKNYFRLIRPFLSSYHFYVGIFYLCVCAQLFDAFHFCVICACVTLLPTPSTSSASSPPLSPSRCPADRDERGVRPGEVWVCRHQQRRHTLFHPSKPLRPR